MSDYQAYLLRLQHHAERANWQVTLENVQTHKMQHLASLEAALQHLEQSALLSDNPPDHPRADARFNLT